MIGEIKLRDEKSKETDAESEEEEYDRKLNDEFNVKPKIDENVKNTRNKENTKK